MAKALIAESGQSVTWRQIVDGDPADALKPWKPGATDETDNTVDIVFFPEDLQGFRVEQRIKGTPIKESYEIGYMAQQTFVPTTKDVMIRDGVEHRVWYIDPIQPDGDDILYVIGFRK